MTLEQRIESDYREAFKRSERGVVAALRLLKAALKNAEIEKRGQLIDADVVTVLRREAKKRRESITLYEQGQRPELAAREREELAVFEHYLPAAVSPEQVASVVAAVVQELGASTPADFGRVMKAAMVKLGESADGASVSAAVKAKLTAGG